MSFAIGAFMRVGTYMGLKGQGNVVLKGARMAGLEDVTFLVGYWIETII